MPKIKQLTLEQIYEQANNLTSKEKKLLKEYLEKDLAAKAKELAEELEVINGDKKQ